MRIIISEDDQKEGCARKKVTSKREQKRKKNQKKEQKKKAQKKEQTKQKKREKVKTRKLGENSTGILLFTFFMHFFLIDSPGKIGSMRVSCFEVSAFSGTFFEIAPLWECRTAPLFQ